MHVWPPVEFYPLGNTLWIFKKAMYALRSAPKDWQTHWASVQLSIGFLRLRPNANVYMHTELQVYIIVYVGDIMIIGAM